MITVADLKRAVGIALSNTTRDQDLGLCVAAAIEWFSSQTGVWFGKPRERTLYFDGDGVADTLWLASDAADTPALVLETYSGSAWETVEVADYTIDGRMIIGANGTPWGYGRRNYRAVYTEGYAPGKGPEQARRAILAVAVAMWKETPRGDVQSESIGGYSYSLKNESAIPAFVRTTIGNFKRFRA